MNSLLSFSEFMQSAAGGILLGALCALLLILVTELNYKLFAKTALDILFALLFIIITSPVSLVLAIISKKRTGKVLEKHAYLGKDGKIVFLHGFAGIKSSIGRLARLFDILRGRLSFVGISLTEVNDGAFMDDDQMQRFAVKPGLINHLVLSGHAELSYEEAFGLDIKYAKRRGFFRDIFIALGCLVLVLRGEGKIRLGETERGYGEVLLARGEISDKDFEKSLQLAGDATTRDERREQFRKQKRG